MNRQAVMDRVDEPCTVLICGIKRPSPRALLCKLNGVEWSGAVLLSALYVLLPLHVGVNPAFSTSGTVALSQRGFQN